MRLVDTLDTVEHSLTELRRNTLWIIEVEDRLAFAAETRPLMLTREKPISPVVIKKQLATGFANIRRCHHNKAWQVLGHFSKSIDQP